MKNLKKTIALLSAFVMAGTMFVGCGADAKTDPAETTTA